jgi:hypothetical protein
MHKGKVSTLVLCLAFAVLATGGQAVASGRAAACSMRATKDTPALENPRAVLKAGQTFGPATQLRVNRSDGSLSLCAHGDYCYPAENLRFTSPCRVAGKPMATPTPDADEWLYTLR